MGGLSGRGTFCKVKEFFADQHFEAENFDLFVFRTDLKTSFFSYFATVAAFSFTPSLNRSLI